MSITLESCINSAMLAVGLTAALQASAVPITYEGGLVSGVTDGGFIQDPSLTGSPNDDFWSFSGNQGDVISLIVNRLHPDLDPAMNLYLGTGNDTNLLTQIAAADDNYPELPGFAGPFADPRIDFTLPSTGSYTVQVWDFLSSAPPPVERCYQITLNGEPREAVYGCGRETVPEPASLALLGIGALAGLGATRRRKTA